MNLASLLAEGADANGRYVYYLFIKTRYDASLSVAQEVAQADNVRWAAELLHPEMTVIAAVLFDSLEPMDDLEALVKQIKLIEGVLDLTAVQVPGAVRFKHGVMWPDPVNGWP